MTEKSGPPELEAARHISSAAARADCDIQFAFFFLFSGDPVHGMAPLTLGWSSPII